MTVDLLPLLDRYPVILAEGAVIEQLRRTTSLQLNLHRLNTELSQVN